MEMIKKQLRKVNDFEKFLDNLTEDEVEKYFLKEDFYAYDNEYKEGFPLFGNLSKPEQRIANSINDHQTGSFDQYEQMQTQIKHMMDVDWKYNRLAELKSQYILDRNKIMLSQLKIKQFMRLIGDKLDFNQKDPTSLIVKSYLCTKSNENRLISEFLDSIFNALDKEMSEPSQDYSDFEEKKQIQTPRKNKSIFNQASQRNREINQMFRKLCVLVKPNFDQELQEEIKLNLNKDS